MTNTQKPLKATNLILWMTQIILSAIFIWAASMKLFSSAEKLAAMWPWTADHPTLVKFTGVLDFVTGIGLVLPSLIRILPKLTIYAAYGTIVLMIAASVFHITRGEASAIIFNIFVALIALFIAWGRQRKVPIAPRGV